MRKADHARIESETRDGKSACAWDFYPDHATLTLLRIGLPTYWFLYEGTPGGKLDAKEDFVIRPDGTEDHARMSPGRRWSPGSASARPRRRSGSCSSTTRSPSPARWTLTSPGRSRREQDGSFQDMTVFGFGRKGYKELVEHVADLKHLPARFSIAFIERADIATARAAYEKLADPRQESRRSRARQTNSCLRIAWRFLDLAKQRLGREFFAGSYGTAACAYDAEESRKPASDQNRVTCV